MAGSGTAHLRDDDDLVVKVEHLVVEFPTRDGKVHAVSDVSLDVADGETLGIVGESGCGKSTTGKAILRLPPPTSGRVLLDGVDLATLDSQGMRLARSQLQMIFQDATSSLNPRRKVGDLVGEGLEIWGIGDKTSRAKKVDEVLDAVGIDPDAARDRSQARWFRSRPRSAAATSSSAAVRRARREAIRWRRACWCAASR